ncbi:MAG: hypothetical protein ACRCX2_11610 [Paraclostridium sp.]
MAVGSRALKEARLNNLTRRRKRTKKAMPDLSVTENLEPNYINLSKELPLIKEKVNKRKRKEQEIPSSDLSVEEDLTPTYYNNTEEIPLEEDMGILPEEVELPEAMDDPFLSLEDQILSRMDNEAEELAPADATFNSNFADDIPEAVRDKIAAYLEEVTKKDKKNRTPWLDIIEKAKNLLGFKIEEIQDGDVANIRKSNSSIGNSAQVKTYDTTFSSSVLRLWATLRSELLPATGPVGFRTDVSVDQDYELKGEMVRDILNEYLTVEDKGFYPDYDRFLLYLILYGCVFRKIYYDPITGKPLSRFIMPEDFLFDNNCSSITESNRLTHIRYLSKREILFNMNSGIFSKLDLDYLDNLGSSEGEEEKDKNEQKQVDPTGSRFPFYETHEYLVLNDFFDDSSSLEDYSIPLPYVITRCGVTNQIVSLAPNWHEDDPTRTRINCFIHYNLFPGFDVFGLGLAQILGSNSKSLTSMQQMAIDAAIFQNFPGGMKSKGIKTTNNDLTILPGQFVTVETGNLSLRDSIMPLPYNGPSPALLEYINRITAQTQELASTTEAGLAENNQNTPVGTTIALLEVSNRMQSAIMRTVHSSFSEELQLFYKMFNLPSLPLDKESLKVIPVSDPSVESSTQRIIKAESILKLASSNPELHNMREVYLKVYQALGINDIDKILLPEVAPQEQQEQPIDPALQVQIADIEQRRLEVESKERLAHLNIEADGYKTQMNIEFDKAKLEQEKYLAELKVREQQQLAEQKYQIELLKLELNEKEKVIDTLTKEQEINSKNELELLKLEYKAKEAELKAQVEALRSQIPPEPTQEEIIYG